MCTLNITDKMSIQHKILVLVDGFDTYMKSKDYSDLSTISYKSSINVYLQWLCVVKHVTDIKQMCDNRYIMQYLSEISENQTKSKAMVFTRKSHLKLFQVYLQDISLITSNDIDVYFSEFQLESIFNGINYIAQMLLLLEYHTSIPLEKLVKLQMQDVEITDDFKSIALFDEYIFDEIPMQLLYRLSILIQESNKTYDNVDRKYHPQIQRTQHSDDWVRLTPQNRWVFSKSVIDSIALTNQPNFVEQVGFYIPRILTKNIEKSIMTTTIPFANSRNRVPYTMRTHIIESGILENFNLDKWIFDNKNVEFVYTDIQREYFFGDTINILPMEEVLDLFEKLQTIRKSEWPKEVMEMLDIIGIAISEENIHHYITGMKLMYAFNQ